MGRIDAEQATDPLDRAAKRRWIPAVRTGQNGPGGWATKTQRKKGKRPAARRCDLLPLLPSGPDGVQRELAVRDLPYSVRGGASRNFGPMYTCRLLAGFHDAGSIWVFVPLSRRGWRQGMGTMGRDEADEDVA